MSEAGSATGGGGAEGVAALARLAAELRPELHRYCARLVGSVIEGEDVVQDAIERALAAWPELDEETPLRPWLFRIAHNRGLDLLRSRALRRTEPIEAAADVAGPASADPVEAAMRKQAVETAVSRFVELPVPQRCVVVLKDVLGESLAEIAALLDLTVDAVKAHLARGRARLREIRARPAPVPAAKPISAATLRFVALFNARDWDGLRGLLADDVRLSQASHPVRVGRADVGLFFTIYAASEPVRLLPCRLEDREAIAVFEGADDAKPAYFMWLEWRGDRVGFIHDYRHARYVVTDADLHAAPAHPGRSRAPAGCGRDELDGVGS